TAGPEADLELVTVVPILLQLLESARRDPAARAVPDGILHQRAPLCATLHADVAGRRGLEDDRQRVLVTIREHGGKQLDVVATNNRGRLASKDRDRLPQALRPLDTTGPDER